MSYPMSCTSAAPSAAGKQRDFVDDCERVKEQLRGRNKYVIDPRHTKRLPLWDALIATGLLYTAMVTPVEICLLQDTDSLGDTWIVVTFFINQFLWLLFSLDMFVNFFLAYQEPIKKGGRWVTNLSEIRRHYLRSWFMIDLVSVLPFELLHRLNVFAFGDDAGDVGDIVRFNRIVRVLRVAKLLRILRTSRLAARWQDKLGLTYANVSMIKWFGSTFYMIHLMACAWAFAGINWTPTEGQTLAWERSWLDVYDFEGSSTYRLYVISLFVAVVAMFGGVGSIVPCNYAEYVVYTTMMLLGSMVWAWVIGSLCGILATLDPHKTAFQNKMDELNHFMADQAFPESFRTRLREFFRHTQDFARQASYDSLLVHMSTQLRGDTAVRVATASLANVWYFSPDFVEKEFLAVVALNLNAAIYEAREALPTDDLTVVQKGLAASELRIFSKGACLGTSCVIPEARSRLRELQVAYSLTFVQSAHISRWALVTMAEHFPLARVQLRKAAAIYTIRGAFRLAYAEWKESRLVMTVEMPSLSSGASSFKARMRRNKEARPRTASTLAHILSAVERAKRANEETLKGPPIERSTHFGADGGGGRHGASVKELAEQMRRLERALEATDRRTLDILSRSEVSEMQAGVLDQKLELIIGLLQRTADDASHASPLRSSHVAKVGATVELRGTKGSPTDGMSNMRRRRKVKGIDQGLHASMPACSAARALAALQPPAASPPTRMLQNAALSEARQAEREEMRAAMLDA